MVLNSKITVPSVRFSDFFFCDFYNPRVMVVNPVSSHVEIALFKKISSVVITSPKKNV